MDLILHQFKTDWRHFRGWLVVLWAFFAAQIILAGSFIDSDLASAMEFVMLLLQILIGAFLLAQLIQADALVGTSAQWLTRPIRRSHLFWAKSAFIVACVGLPRLIPQIIVSGWHHYTFDLFLTSMATLLIFVLFTVGLLSALAALTPDLSRYFLALGLLIGGFLIWTAAYEFNYDHQNPRYRPPSLTESAMTVAFLFAGFCALVVFMRQALGGRPAAGFVIVGFGLLAIPVIIGDWRLDFLKPQIQSLRSSLAVSSLEATGAPADPADGQVFWSTFVLSGLPAHSVLVAESAMGTFTPQGKSRGISSGMSLSTRVSPMNSDQEPEYLAVIRQFFPPETLWSEQPQANNWDGSMWRHFFAGGRVPHSNTGNMNCDVEFDQFLVQVAAQIPLRPGTYNIAPGQRLVIHKLSPQQNGVLLQIEEISVDPLLSRKLYGPGGVMSGRTRNFGTYVVYTPEWAKAEVLRNNQLFSSSPDILNGEEHCLTSYILTYPLLEERLAGISLQDFLDKARLYVFVPQYQGTVRQMLVATNFNIANVHPQDSTLADEQKNLASIQPPVLPAQPTTAQISDYLDTLFWQLPDFPVQGQEQKIRHRLEAIGTAGVPLLLARLPLDVRTERDYIFPVLTKLATRDQLPELRKALGRDLQLAEWFHQMNWDDDARDVVLAKLNDHREVFPATALLIAAAARDPVTYSDLAWHFVRLPNQQADVAEALAQCPGFELAGTVRDAWARARLGLVQPGDLALLAARQGLPDAFNQAVIQLERSRDSLSNIHQQTEALQIASLTDFSGSPDAAMDWLSSNLGHFNYDAVTHRYLLSAP